MSSTGDGMNNMVRQSRNSSRNLSRNDEARERDALVADLPSHIAQEYILDNVGLIGTRVHQGAAAYIKELQAQLALKDQELAEKVKQVANMEKRTNAMSKTLDKWGLLVEGSDSDSEADAEGEDDDMAQYYEPDSSLPGSTPINEPQNLEWQQQQQRQQTDAHESAISAVLATYQAVKANSVSLGVAATQINGILGHLREKPPNLRLILRRLQSLLQSHKELRERTKSSLDVLNNGMFHGDAEGAERVLQEWLASRDQFFGRQEG